MSLFRKKLEIVETFPSLLLTSLDFALLDAETHLFLSSSPLRLSDSADIFVLDGAIPSPFHLFDVTHLRKNTPFSTLYRRICSSSSASASASLIGNLYDRISALELACFDEVKQEAESKYTWAAEIKCPDMDWLDQKCKLMAELKGSETHGVDRDDTWEAEIKAPPDKCGVDRKYAWTTEIKGGGGGGRGGGKEKDGKPKSVAIKIKEPVAAAAGDNKNRKAPCLVEVEEPLHQGAIFLRQAFGRRVGAVARLKGKAKELSPQEAARVIQRSFRAYIIRRSQALRSLRELAVAKTKLKELRVLFNLYSYRRQIAGDAEERKRFCERIIALLLAVDAVQGVDVMVRASRRTMLDELETMLDVVDPQPGGKLDFLQRRKFGLLEGSIQNEMLDQAEKAGNGTLEECL